MVFVVLGVLLLALKLAGMAPVAEWSWWLVLAPFALAVAWWAFSDKTGRTQREAMRNDQERKDHRRRTLATGMGLRHLFDRKVAAKLKRADEREQALRQRQTDKVVKQRERQRQIIRDSVLTTRMDSQFDSQSTAAAKPEKP
jgi:small Trp-rich protein